MPRNYLQYQSYVEPPPAGTSNPALAFWRPKYPDHKLTRPELLAAIQAGSSFFVELVPAAVSADQGVSGGGGALFPGRIIQYLAGARPFDAALTPTTTTIEWVATPPDPLRRVWRPEGGVSWTPQHSAAEGSALDWTPKAPDWIAARPRSTEFPHFVLPQREQKLPAPWKAIYPDLIARLVMPTAFQAAFASHEAPEQTIASAAWKPTYPDAIDRKVLAAANQPAFQWGGSPSAFPVREGWRPIFPDRFPAPTLAWQQPYAANIDPLPAVVALTYSTPTYPDLLPRILRTPATGAVGSLQPEVTIPNAWSALYPDWIAAAKRIPAATQQAYTANITPEQTIARAWGPVYPDAIDRRVLSTAAQPFLARSLQPEVTSPNAWSTVYPDWVARRTLPSAAHQTLALISPSYFPVPPLGWAGTYPSAVDRLRFPAASQLSYTANVIPITGGSVIVYKFIVIVGD